MCSWPSAAAQIQENPFEPDGRLQKRITKITYLIVGTNKYSENTTKNLTIHRPESVFNPTASSFPSSQGSIYPPNVSAPPPQKKVLLKKIYNYFK